MDLPSDEQLESLSNADAGLIAQELTGKPYKESEDTSRLMTGLHLMLGQARKNAYASVDDTYWGMPFEELLRIAKGEGFKEIARFDVPRYKYATTEIEDVDVRIIMHHPIGFYLNVDSYGTRYKEAPTVNGCTLSYSAQLRPDLAEAIIHNAEVGDEWEAANPNWWYIRDERPNTLTTKQEEEWYEFLSVRGNHAWDKKNRQIYALATDYSISEGLRLKLFKLKKQTSWIINPKMKAWEWWSGRGFRNAPSIGYQPIERTDNDGNSFVSYAERRIADEEWFAMQLEAFPEEHRYLKDLPQRDDISNS